MPGLWIAYALLALGALALLAALDRYHLARGNHRPLELTGYVLIGASLAVALYTL